MSMKNYRRGMCCKNCKHFAAYVVGADGCDKHGVRIADTSMCDSFEEKGVSEH